MRGDITKLPKWAQNEIRRLERNEADLRARLAVGPEDSNTFADPYSATPRPLGRGTTISFRLHDRRGSRIHANVTLRADGTRSLYLNAGERMLVIPESSNAVRIETRPS